MKAMIHQTMLDPSSVWNTFNNLPISTLDPMKQRRSLSETADIKTLSSLPLPCVC